MRVVLRYILLTFFFVSVNLFYIDAKDADVSFISMDGVIGNYYKIYHQNDTDSVNVYTSYSLTSIVPKEFYVQIGNTAPDASYFYVAVDATQKIDSISFLVSSNGSTTSKIIVPVLLGWNSVFNKSIADYAVYNDSLDIYRGLDSAKWVTYDLTKKNLTKVRLYRAIRYIQVNDSPLEATSQLIGGVNTVWVYGTKVYLRHFYAPLLKSVAIIDTITRDSIVNCYGQFSILVDSIVYISTYPYLTKGSCIKCSNIKYVTDSLDCSVSFYKNGALVDSFYVGDTIRMMVSKNGLNSSYNIYVISSAVSPTIKLDGESGIGSQRVLQYANIEPIIFDVSNGRSVKCEGLPNGLSFNEATYTISGMPKCNAGTYTYKIIVVGNPASLPDTVYYINTIYVVDANVKKILYLTAASTSSDSLFNSLTNRYFVTVATPADSAKTLKDYEDYDLIIIHESVSGTNGEALGLKNIDKSILNLKVYLYGAKGDSTVRWRWGIPGNGSDENSTDGIGATCIEYNYPNHPIFNGLVSSDSLQIIKNDFSTDNNKTIQVLLSSNVQAYTLAYCAGRIAIQEVLPKIRIDSSSTSKYIMVPLYSGIMDDLNSNGLSLLNNVVEYLLNNDVYDYSSVNLIDYATINVDKSSTIKVLGERNSIRIINAKGNDVEIYDTIGNLVLRRSKIDNDVLCKVNNSGIYIVRIGSYGTKVFVW